MKSQFLISIILCCVFVLQPISGLAFETDQFNLPPVPLADIGDEVSEYVEATLAAAVAEVNREIVKSKACLNPAIMQKDCGSAGAERKKLEHLRSNDAVAERIYRELSGSSLMFTKFGSWIESHKFKAQPSSYKTSFSASIFVALPADYLTISPTVRLYGNEFGVDKLEHLFQQGYKYYTIQRDAAAKGATQADAVKQAINYGRRSEKTYYGLMTSGVYSNADMVANYVGMKFYQHLTKPVAVGTFTREPLLSLVDGDWLVNSKNLRDDILKPFLTEHLNEAFNPSGYAFNLYPFVLKTVAKNSCPRWKERYPSFTQTILAERSNALELWNGEDYGYTKRDRTVRIGEVCFSESKK
ncbi:hypothetical protein BH10ACI3_BH10ACI3_01280 [soil metagenome]